MEQLIEELEALYCAKQEAAALGCCCGAQLRCDPLPEPVPASLRPGTTREKR
ncbi:Bgt-20781 [Blumeria graminis f. sp. tritici]|uniref:Bgt-20781 n=2 Tax=Blumeria graminis f. sp. tritici TaxID=62690 RepID=A0A9X9MGD6_BLUGR|nr:Bgt-20781 [Blumeria graminis f. sp. tritici]